IGPTTMFFAVLTAEAAAYALTLFPTSPTFWYLNLEFFSIFQKSHYILNSYIDIPYFQLIFIGLPLSVAAICGLVCKHRLALAAASSLSFVYAVFVLCAWFVNDGWWYHFPQFIARASEASVDVFFSGALLTTTLFSC